MKFSQRKFSQRKFSQRRRSLSFTRRPVVRAVTKSPDKQARRRQIINVSVLVLAGALLWMWVGLVQAKIGGLPTNTGDTDTSENWEKLRPKLFADRQIFLPPSQVQLDVPRRVAFGATVPVRVTVDFEQSADFYVKRLYLIVDNNPSPVAATIDITPQIGKADFETRIRVDEYSHVRVVAEYNDGQLHMDSRYVKTSGGCSAPPNREHMDKVGNILLRMAENKGTINPDKPMAVDFQVRHPNDTGFELNNQTVMFIPPHFVRNVDILYAGQPVWSADLDFSISENPYFRFNLIPGKGGALRANVKDSKGQEFTRTVPIVID